MSQERDIQNNIEDFKSEYYIETVCRSIRLSMEIHDLPLSQTFKMLTPIFGNELIELAKEKIFNKNFTL